MMALSGKGLVRFGQNPGVARTKATPLPRELEQNPFEDAFRDILILSSSTPQLSRRKTTESMLGLEEIPMTDEYDKKSDQKVVHYLTPEEREQYRLRIKDGELCDAQGKPLKPAAGKKTETYIYVVNKHREFFGCPGKNDKGISHSSFLEGERVAGAGQLRVTQNKYVFDNSSGHYKPPKKILDQTLEILRHEKMDMSKVRTIVVSA